MKTCNYSNFQEVVSGVLEVYSKDISEGIAETAKKVAEDGKETLKRTSPVNRRKTSARGRYAKGWKVKVKQGVTFINCKIHNSTDYQLTHLLEYGHLARDGSKVRAYPHIKAVEETCKTEYVKKVENIIRKDG